LTVTKQREKGSFAEGEGVPELKTGQGPSSRASWDSVTKTRNGAGRSFGGERKGGEGPAGNLRLERELTPIAKKTVRA